MAATLKPKMTLYVDQETRATILEELPPEVSCSALLRRAVHAEAERRRHLAEDGCGHEQVAVVVLCQCCGRAMEFGTSD